MKRTETAINGIHKSVGWQLWASKRKGKAVNAIEKGNQRQAQAFAVQERQTGQAGNSWSAEAGSRSWRTTLPPE